MVWVSDFLEKTCDTEPSNYSNPCTLIAGPAMTYAEWYGDYAVDGAVVPAGTQVP